MASDHMTIKQAATLLNVSEITIKRYIRENLIPSTETDGNVTLLTADVEKYKAINEQFAHR